MTLGKLEQELKRQGLDPSPSFPYHGIAYTALAQRLGAMRLSSLCDELKRPISATGRNSTHYKVIAWINNYILDVARKELIGLDLPAPTS
jgi:hypothetical protein